MPDAKPVIHVTSRGGRFVKAGDLLKSGKARTAIKSLAASGLGTREAKSGTAKTVRVASTSKK